jgi:hypothetical protein
MGKAAWVARGETRAVHSAGYEIFYSRYSASYLANDARLTLAAEMDEDGALLLHAPEGLEQVLLDRIEEGLRFLGVKFRHDPA